MNHKVKTLLQMIGTSSSDAWTVKICYLYYPVRYFLQTRKSHSFVRFLLTEGSSPRKNKNHVRTHRYICI